MKSYLFLIAFCLTSLSVLSHNRFIVESNLAYSPPIDAIATDSSKLVFYSKFNKAGFDISYMSNTRLLNQLDDLFSDASSTSTIDALKIIVSASPDGKYDYNIRLAQARARSLKRMLLTRYPLLKGVTIEVDSYVTDWSKLEELIENDFNLPYRSTVKNVLNLDRDVGAIGWKLKQIGRNKEAWRYITRKYMHHLRVADIIVQKTYKEEIPAKKLGDTEYRDAKLGDTEYRDAKLGDTEYRDVKTDEIQYREIKTVDTLHIYTQLGKKASDTLHIYTHTGVKTDTLHIYIHTDAKIKDETIKTLFDVEEERTDFLALKTNLLFDALTLINVELEVPIGNRWSVAGELMFPWWVGKNNDKALQSLSGTVEGRYWFGDRLTKPKLTGWFAGVYAGGGIYDIQYDSKGYQGDHFFTSGISGGFAHTINKSKTLRMEYSLGVGYLETNYEYYEGEEDNKYLVWQNDGKFTWIGPTRAKISLVWILSKKKGDKR